MFREVPKQSYRPQQSPLRVLQQLMRPLLSPANYPRMRYSIYSPLFSHRAFNRNGRTAAVLFPLGAFLVG